ncbi:MAG: hypothetical protein IT259_12280 [Saprospiraceae bacterium]|nr:hypothetical protein [Saprospiraceae bacterium]
MKSATTRGGGGQERMLDLQTALLRKKRAYVTMNTPNLTPRLLFLIDACGAALSALMLGFVLPHFEAAIGMPRAMLYGFAAAACVFALYSFSNYYQMRANWRPYLTAIAAANLLYCCATAAAILYGRGQLTAAGWVYFLLEIGVIVCLAMVEWRMAGR